MEKTEKKLTFEEVWNNILANQGNEFRIITGEAFTYTVNGNILRVTGVNQNISKTEVEKAFNMLPFDGPGAIHNIRGPSYIWALLHDERIVG